MWWENCTTLWFMKLFQNQPHEKKKKWLPKCWCVTCTILFLSWLKLALSRRGPRLHAVGPCVLSEKNPEDNTPVCEFRCLPHKHDESLAQPVVTMAKWDNSPSGWTENDSCKCQARTGHCTIETVCFWSQGNRGVWQTPSGPPHWNTLPGHCLCSGWCILEYFVAQILKRKEDNRINIILNVFDWYFRANTH